MCSKIKTTVKCIIKYALICEIIIAIIGELGEFIIRIQEYINFFKQLNLQDFDIYTILLSIGVVFIVINVLFAVSVAYELLYVLILETILWIIQLALSLSLLPLVIIPSIFTILIISIVLILNLILISLIMDENNLYKRKNSQKMTIKLINVNDLEDL